MSFKDMVTNDIKAVFQNETEFAELMTVIYDGVTYADIPVVLDNFTQADRSRGSGDHIQGIFLANTMFYAAQSDMGGRAPEKGGKIKVGDGVYFETFYVKKAVCEMGQIALELEALDE